MNESNRRRVLAGTCAAVLSATLLLAVVMRFFEDDKPSHGVIAAAGFLAVLHVGLTIGAVFGITHLVRHRADRLGLFGAALTFLGATVGARIMALIQVFQLGNAAPDPVRTAMASMADAPLIVFISIIPIGLLYPIGLITLGIALCIARYRAIGALMIAGGIAFPIGRAVGIMPALSASDALLAVTYGWLARVMWAEWEAGRAGTMAPHPQTFEEARS